MRSITMGTTVVGNTVITVNGMVTVGIMTRQFLELLLVECCMRFNAGIVMTTAGITTV
jgi:hypothetical protein